MKNIIQIEGPPTVPKRMKSDMMVMKYPPKRVRVIPTFRRFSLSAGSRMAERLDQKKKIKSNGSPADVRMKVNMFKG